MKGSNFLWASIPRVKLHLCGARTRESKRQKTHPVPRLGRRSATARCWASCGRSSPRCPRADAAPGRSSGTFASCAAAAPRCPAARTGPEPATAPRTTRSPSTSTDTSRTRASVCRSRRPCVRDTVDGEGDGARPSAAPRSAGMRDRSRLRGGACRVQQPTDTGRRPCGPRAGQYGIISCHLRRVSKHGAIIADCWRIQNVVIVITILYNYVAMLHRDIRGKKALLVLWDCKRWAREHGDARRDWGTRSGERVSLWIARRPYTTRRQLSIVRRIARGSVRIGVRRAKREWTSPRGGAEDRVSRRVLRVAAAAVLPLGATRINAPSRAGQRPSGPEAARTFFGRGRWAPECGPSLSATLARRPDPRNSGIGHARARASL